MANAVAAWDAEVDVLIVGSGAAAMTAAVVARKTHADALVIEKSELYGGSSATSGGVVWIPATRQAREAGSDDTPEDGFKYIRALTAPDVPDSLIWAFVNNGPKMLEWMEQNSDVHYATTHYCDYHPNLPGGKTAYRSHDAMPIHASALGKDFLNQRAQHPAAQFFGKINWTVDETTPLLFRLPGWKKIVARLFLRYYLDLPWRFRSARDRFLTLGSALAARLKTSMDKVGVCGSAPARACCWPPAVSSAAPRCGPNICRCRRSIPGRSRPIPATRSAARWNWARRPPAWIRPGGAFRWPSRVK